MNAFWKVNSGADYNLAKECEHADTAVLDLDVTKTVASLQVSSIELAKGIHEEAEHQAPPRRPCGGF